MTEKEKRTILDMRSAGKQYKEIRLVFGRISSVSCICFIPVV